MSNHTTTGHDARFLEPLPILPRRRVQIVNVVSRKGGAGKTTMALLAARYLAERPGNPLVTLFDLDFSGTSLDHALYPGDGSSPGTTPFEHYLLEEPGELGWEAQAADALSRYPREGSMLFLYGASADQQGTSEEQMLAGPRSRDLVRARLRRLVRWVIEQFPTRRQFYFVLDNSPGIRGLSKDLLDTMFDPQSGAAMPPPAIEWANVFVTTPDRQDILAAFSAWLDEWQQAQQRLERSEASRSTLELRAAQGLLFLVNKMLNGDRGIETLLGTILPPTFTESGYGRREILELIESRKLQVAHCEYHADLAIFFRGLRPLEVPTLEAYVPGLGKFLDSLSAPPVVEPPAPSTHPPVKRGRDLGSYFTRVGRTIDLEPVADALAVSAVPLGGELRAPLRAELEQRGLYRTVALQQPDVEVYLARSASDADRVMKEYAGKAGVRYVNRVYRYDSTREDNVLVLTDRLAVRFAPDLTTERVMQAAGHYGIHLAERVDGMPHGYLARVKRGAVRNALEIANQLVADGLVVFAEPDWVRALTFRGAPRSRLSEEDQWHLSNAGKAAGSVAGADAKVLAAWDQQATGQGITIAVIDGGIDIDHVQLDVPGKLTQGLDVWFTSSRAWSQRAESHGTAVAGVALAARSPDAPRAPAGVAPDARLMPIRTSCLDAHVLAETDLYRAFTHARVHGADIVTCSWGPPRGYPDKDLIPPLVAFAIDRLVQEGRGGLGTPVFFAAGNGSESVSSDGWASYANVIAVAASNHADIRAEYSNFGPEIWVCAPSDPAGIVTLAPQDEHCDDFGGTSSACPLVAGVAALVLSANPKLTWTEVKAILAETADKIDSTGTTFEDRYGQQQSTAYTNGHSPAYGHGRVNAANAVREAKRRE